jgi:hypothetical protein
MTIIPPLPESEYDFVDALKDIHHLVCCACIAVLIELIVLEFTNDDFFHPQGHLGTK